MIFFANQKSLFLQVGQHAFTRCKPIQAGVCSCVRVHPGMLVHHRNLGQLVAQPGLKVIGIVRRSHLHRARAELRLRQFVGDYGNLAIHQRQQNFLAMQMDVALVLRVHRNRSIAQHRLWPRGRNRDELRASHHGIADLPQLSRNLFVLHFQI